MGRFAWFAVVIVCAGCSRKHGDEYWNERVITDVQVGPYKLKIPSGWRDMSEVKNGKMRDAVPKTQHWLAQDGQPVSQRSPTIPLGWAADRPKRSCAAFDAENS